MIKRIDHISIAVRELGKAKAFFIDKLGGRELYSAPLEGQNFRWTTIELGSSCLLELVDPIGNEGFLQRFLDHNGDGMHHITIQVEDAEAMTRMLEDQGIPFFGYNEDLPGWKEFFIHPKDAFGALLQFAEFKPLDWIYPGYVPKAYEEFVEEAPIQEAGEVSARVIGEKGKRRVVLTQGDVSLKIDQEDIPNLIHTLKKVADDI